ncbi:hypothetical protein RQN30_02785 [Arcanobacterium hippocoleae]
MTIKLVRNCRDEKIPTGSQESVIPLIQKTAIKTGTSTNRSIVKTFAMFNSGAFCFFISIPALISSRIA